MDYETKPTNRRELRLYAKLFRVICGLSDNEPIDPVALLDRLPELDGFADVCYEVVYNNQLPKDVPSRCIKAESGYCIQIKESVYTGAYKKKTGGHRMHIMHEIVHVFVDKLGYTPIFSRKYSNEKIPAFRSLEWIVKALAGEIMMPYEATIGMTKKEIIDKYHVSDVAASMRLKY